jgi:hypothetical protein
MFLIHVPNQVPQPYTKITNKRPLIIHHPLHKPNTINPYINNTSNSHCYATSICTNNFNNTPQPKSLKHVPLIYQSYTKTTNKCLSQCTTRYANKSNKVHQQCTSLDLPQNVYYNKNHTTNNISRKIPKLTRPNLNHVQANVSNISQQSMPMTNNKYTNTVPL